MPRIAIAAAPDEAALAHQLAATLARPFGRRRVTPLDAVPQPPHRWTALDRADVAILIVGPRWPDLLRTPFAPTLLADVEVALRPSMPRLVLPVLAPGAEMPPPAALPPHLQAFAYLQAIPLGEGGAGSDRIAEAISTYLTRARSEQRAAGNYTWLKLLSASPIALFLGMGVAMVLLKHLGFHSASPGMRPLSILGSLLFVASILCLWVATPVIALRAKRYIWAAVTGLGLPMGCSGVFILTPLIIALQNQQSSLWGWLLVLAVLALLLGLFGWPLIFALTLPPHRKRRGAL